MALVIFSINHSNGSRKRQLSESELLNQSVRLFLQYRLRQVKAESSFVYSRYRVGSVEEIEARYEDGTLEEAGSWQDLQRLDHLEYEQDRFEQLLEAVYGVQSLLCLG